MTTWLNILALGCTTGWSCRSQQAPVYQGLGPGAPPADLFRNMQPRYLLIETVNLHCWRDVAPGVAPGVVNVLTDTAKI